MDNFLILIFFAIFAVPYIMIFSTDIQPNFTKWSLLICMTLIIIMDVVGISNIIIGTTFVIYTLLLLMFSIQKLRTIKNKINKLGNSLKENLGHKYEIETEKLFMEYHLKIKDKNHNNLLFLDFNKISALNLLGKYSELKETISKKEKNYLKPVHEILKEVSMKDVEDYLKERVENTPKSPVDSIELDKNDLDDLICRYSILYNKLNTIQIDKKTTGNNIDVFNTSIELLSSDIPGSNLILFESISHPIDIYKYSINELLHAKFVCATPRYIDSKESISFVTRLLYDLEKNEKINKILISI